MDTIGVKDSSLSDEQLDQIVPLIQWVSFAVIGWKTDLGFEYPTLDDARKAWENELKTYAQQKEHCGDCTNLPMTCIRCLVEDQRKDAQTLVRFLNGETCKK